MIDHLRPTLTSTLRRPLVSTLALLCASALARPAAALTEQAFEGSAGDTGFALLNALAVEGGAPAEVLAEGTDHFLRLAGMGAMPSHNTITFPATESTTTRLLADFDFRITPVTGNADGFGLAFLNADVYPDAAVPPPPLAEEPGFDGSLAIAFDVFPSPGESAEQHISVHFGGVTFEFSEDHFPELASGVWLNARVIVEFIDGGAYVSLALREKTGSACALIDRFKVSGVMPYRARAWLGARAGGIISTFDVDNLRFEATDPAETGAWSVPHCGPAIPIHAALLPDGRILTADRHDFSPTPGPWIIDPESSFVEAGAEPGYDAFCAGHTHLGDGRLFFAGGHWFDSVGVDRAAIYDPTTDRWQQLPAMNDGRWYPTARVLGDGTVVVLSGEISPTLGVNRLPQVFDPVTRRWRDLTNALRTLPLYPWAFSAPDGRAFVAGPEPESQFLSVNGLGEWQELVPSVGGFRDYGSAVSYDAGRILKAGGSEVDAMTGATLAPAASAEVIDLGAPEPTWQATAAMRFARRQFTLVTLADGSVLAVGGTSSAGFSDGAGSVLAPELWDPPTGVWRTLDRAMVPRVYHHTALLLPDGRVWVGGSGHPISDNAGDQQDWEILTPPYLRTGAPRPEILELKSRIVHGETVAVRIRGAAAPVINLARLGADTHDFDQSALMIQNLPVVARPGSSESFDVTMPENPNLAPPGPYMVFALSDGVPSMAKIVLLGAGDGNAGGGGGAAGAGSDCGDDAGIADCEAGGAAPGEGTAGADGAGAASGNDLSVTTNVNVHGAACSVSTKGSIGDFGWQAGLWALGLGWILRRAARRDAAEGR